GIGLERKCRAQRLGARRRTDGNQAERLALLFSVHRRKVVRFLALALDREAAGEAFDQPAARRIVVAAEGRETLERLRDAADQLEVLLQLLLVGVEDRLEHPVDQKSVV